MDMQLDKFEIMNYNVEHRSFAINFENVVIRGIECRGYLSIRINADGTFTQDFRHGGGAIYRTDKFLETAPEGCRKKVVEFAIEAVKEWIRKNPNYIVDTKILDLNRDIARAESEIEDLQKKIQEQEDILSKKRNELQTLLNDKG